ncbi:MAG: isopentenyl-diphosphate Delta-isomerase [Pseudomonadota bacterium]
MIDAEEKVILVDAQDRETGLMDKLAAHRQGLRHRAISVFIWNDRGEMLLQQRALSKYHSGGLWANATCSHPRAGEAVADAAARRLLDEVGIETRLTPLFVTEYRADVGGGCVEHELVHVFSGDHSGPPRPAPAEVAACRWCSPERLDAWMREAPEDFTSWFRIYMNTHRDRILAA